MMIHGDNVTLRGLELEDLEMLHIWMNDFSIITQLLRIEPSIRCFTEKWFQEVGGNNAKRIFAIEENKTGQFIGCVGANHIDFINRKSDFYIYIGNSAFRGKGYAKEATRLFVEYMFDYYNLHKIYLWVRSDNLKAIELYKKVGFQEEGLLRQDHFIDGKYIDLVFMGLLRDEYQK